MNEPQ